MIFGSYHFAYHLRSFLFFFLVILVGFLLQILVVLSDKYKLAKQHHGQIIEEYVYWSKVAAQYPSIPDILYNAAVSSFNAGKPDEAKDYASQAIKIDPLFEKARELNKELGE